MKKILLTILALLMVNTAVFAFPFGKKDTSLVTMPLFSTQSKAENTVWVGTFQLVWNDLMDDIVKGDVRLTGGNDEVVNGLNQQVFKSSMLTENSYYKTHGVMTIQLRDDINKALLEKFNETSELLKSVDWNGHDYLLYAMLKKDFQFPYVYDELAPAKFGKSKQKVKYFGINNKSNEGLRSKVDVLFYNSKNDYAVILNTKDKDMVMLYRTNDKVSLAKAYQDMLEKSFKYEGDKQFNDKDELKVPFLKFKNDYEYKNLANKRIKGTDFTIGSAVQNIDFNLDNKGVKLKSEAGMIMKMSMPIPDKKEEVRKFNFDDNFYIFIQENLNHPYFAMKVGDVNGINK